MYFRWINADEGAHLLDARFLLQGMIPVVDYASRQPVYTLLLAVLVKLFGPTLSAGRMLPILASLGIGWMIFLIGRRLFESRVGLTAAVIYLFLPYTIIWSTVVKTEMPAVFLCCLSVYFLICALQSETNSAGFFILSGAAAALAFYVRQPTIYLPLTILVLLVFYSGPPFRSKLHCIILFLAGYLLPCLLVIGYYWEHLNLSQILLSQLNPGHLVFNRVAHFIGVLPAAWRVVDSDSYRILDQDVTYTLQSWRDSLLFALFIILAAMTYAQRVWRRSVASRLAAVTGDLSMLLMIWPVLMLAAYLFQSIQSVFYSQYFLESLPLLTVLAAAQIIYLGDQLSLSRLSILLAFAAIFFTLFIFMHEFYSWRWPIAVHFTLAVLLTIPAMIWLRRKQMVDESNLLRSTAAGLTAIAIAWVGDRIGVEPLLYLALALVGFALIDRWHRVNGSVSAVPLICMGMVLTASWSGARIGLQYECTWSQRTLERVVHILKQHGEKTDTVMSGAMIWTFSSGLQPYSGVTHPTVYVKKEVVDFNRIFQQEPPDFIIVDGQTEKKFARYWPFILSEIDRAYHLLSDVPGSRRVVKIYRRHEAPAMMAPALAHAVHSKSRGVL
ncbi:glycosyltransferase family 39 protein [candidate division KSB1 bacterium]|nr:glycosyltransferase family 39 protein [candidate division KSB1 bacterium]